MEREKADKYERISAEIDEALDLKDRAGLRLDSAEFGYVLYHVMSKSKNKTFTREEVFEVYRDKMLRLAAEIFANADPKAESQRKKQACSCPFVQDALKSEIRTISFGKNQRKEIF